VLAEGYKARNMDGVHDLLLRLGDLSREELRRSVAAEDDIGRAVTQSWYGRSA
jgi:ATP-dependent Lhr-like helicase